MELMSPLGCVDVQNFQFKLQRRVRAFKAGSVLPPGQLQLLTAASRYGILFATTPENQLHVFQTRSVFEGEGLQSPRRIMQFSGHIINLALNCTQELLSIVYKKNNTLFAAICDSKKCVTENLTLLNQIVLSPTNNVDLLRLLWNPCLPDTLAVVTSDGILSVFQCKQNSVGAQSKPANARCLSWSPKGKQLVTGNADGSLSQWKPDLSLVKTVPPPPNVVTTLTIHWISTAQFCVVYQDRENGPCVTIVNTPKAGNPVCINYEDICYSMGDTRPTQYFLTHIPAWGVILVSSANSMEVGVLGTTDQINWQQWIQMDDARAELPLTEDKQECYPVGVALDDSAILQLPWGENETLPFMPALHILSHTGLLVTFFCINLSSLSETMCNLPEELTIPPYHCILESEISQPPLQATAVATSLGGSSNDISFAFPSITSTPTISKAVAPSQNAGPKTVISNLFGVQTSSQPAKLVTESSSINNPPMSAVSKPIASFALPVITTLPPQAPEAVPTRREYVPTVNTEPSPSQIANMKGSQKITENKSTSNSVSNETIKSLYLKEINEFQSHLYEVKKKHIINTQIGTPEEIKQISAILEKQDVEPVDKVYSYLDVKQQISLSKQCLVKMCSVLIEAKLQPESLELGQLAQLDPVSQEKMTSIKKMMYYVESQLKQVSSVLDDQWNTFQENCMRGINAQQQINNGDMMRMPTLDKVYQPLVKHQDILAKQQATVKTLQKLFDNLKSQINNTNTRKSFDSSMKSMHTLSSLTKNLLNFNIQSTDLLEAKYKSVFESDSKYTKKKHSALRDLLGERNVVRIKPVKVELVNKWESFLDQEKLSFVKQEVKKENDYANQIEKVALPEITKIEEKKSCAPFLSSSGIETVKNIGVQPSNPLNNLNKFVTNLGNGIHKTDVTSTSIVKSIPQSTGASTLFQKSFQPSVEAVAPLLVNNTDVSSLLSKICSPTPRTDTQNYGVVPVISVASKNNEGEKKIEDVKPMSTVSTSLSFQPAQTVVISAVSQITAHNQKDLKPITSAPPPSYNFGSLSISQATPISSSTINVIKTEPAKLFGGAASGGTSFFGFSSNTATSNLFAPKPASISSQISGTTITKPVSITVKAVAQIKPDVVKTESSPSSVSPTELLSMKPISTSQITATKPTSIFAGNASTPVTPAIVVSEIKATSITPVISPSVSSPPTSSLSTVQSILPSSSVTPTSTSSPTKAATFSSMTPTTMPLFSTPVVASTTVSQTTTSLFTAPTTTTSVFSNPITSVSTFSGSGSSSLFGNVTPTTSSVFGTTQSSPGFGVAPAATSLFASANASLASTGNMFESLSVTTTAASPSSIFGSPTPATCASSIFGLANAAVPSTATSLFGNASMTTASSPFGGGSNTSGSMFGSSSFGQPSGNSLFGGGSPSAFGQPQPQSNVFGSGNTFGSNVFGSPSNVFGQSGAPQGSNIFGSPTPATSAPGSIFGGASPVNQGQSLFGSPAFGSPSTQNSVFGGSPAFDSKSLFGQSSFGSPSSGAFGSFSGSGEQQNVGQTGFGSPNSFGKPATFSGSPGFASPGGFGSSPTFGASATFGGSPVKLFSSPGAADQGFGSSQNSTFENMATQNTLTFGNLAQQTQQNTMDAPPFQSKSFTSWR